MANFVNTMTSGHIKNKYTLNPTERLTSVLPTFRTSNIEGARMSYQSDIDVSEYLYRVYRPVHTFAGERVNNLLLDTLLTLR